MKKKFILMTMIFQMLCVFCEDNDLSFVKEAGEQYFATLPYGENWTLARSSALRENGKSIDLYERDKAFDNNKDTAWVEGVPSFGRNEYIMTNVLIRDGKFYYDVNYHESKEESGIKIYLSILNGFCKNQNLYFSNNRVKKARIVFYDTPISIGQDYTTIRANPIIVFEKEIELEDVMEEQKFCFNLTTRVDFPFCTAALLMQLTILDVYRGTDYDDTCISEIKVYGEYAE